MMKDELEKWKDKLHEIEEDTKARNLALSLFLGSVAILIILTVMLMN